MDRNMVWCMGTHKPTVIENGLRFNVNGRFFKGIVEITLNGGDLYDIKFIKPVRKQNEIAKSVGVKKFDITNVVQSEVNDVFFEDMMNILGAKVECGDAEAT
jgi:hypothetical protein